jgi:hypothetical protein
MLHPYSLRAFRSFQELGMKHHGLKNLSETKQNKKKKNNLTWMLKTTYFFFSKNGNPKPSFSTYLKLFFVNWQKDHCMEP